MDKLFDYKCSKCGHIDEVWTEDPATKYDCPSCMTTQSYERTYRQFGILQTSVSDSANSWPSTRGTRRRTYGENRAHNGL